MAEITDKKVLLSLKDVEVKFNVRGRILTAIRRVSLDIYENEALAIVGESGSGKSVLTKTFAGMLDSNGFISNGSIIFSDDEISETQVKLTARNRRILNYILNMLNKNSVLERGAPEYVEYKKKQNEIKYGQSLTPEEEERFAAELKALTDDIVDKTNYLQTLDKRNPDDAREIASLSAAVKDLTVKKEQKIAEKEAIVKDRVQQYKKNAERIADDKKQLAGLLARRKEKIAVEDQPGNPYGLSDAVLERNKKIAYEILLSIGRYPLRSQVVFIAKLEKAFILAMSIGEDLNDPEVRNKIFDVAAFRVEFRSLDEENQILHGYAIIDCAKVKYTNDWQQIRGCRIATVFQDPMTSLNPVFTVGNQLSEVFMLHQGMSKDQAMKASVEALRMVDVALPEKRVKEYPFQLSGGMRQRVMIAMALACRPKLLIADEPTTALDVTIQAQVLQLMRDLRDETGTAIMFITHDLGVVSEMCERAIVLYCGEIMEEAPTKDIFSDPKHPYTEGLLAALPHPGQREGDLYVIPGMVPPAGQFPLGCVFAPRCRYATERCLKEKPPTAIINEKHRVRCFRYESEVADE
jgi:oligopeptide transport system ATP-binding protein